MEDLGARVTLHWIVSKIAKEGSYIIIHNNYSISSNNSIKLAKEIIVMDL